MVHLDSASAGRASTATLAAVADHARLEATIGTYSAQERVEPALDRLRGDLAELLGPEPDGIALVDSATSALLRLLSAWPVRGLTVGVVAAEWGPNLELLAHAGAEFAELDTDPAGHVDVDALTRRLRTGRVDLVHLTHVTSHRGLVQPVRPVVEVCHAAGVPVWVDAAQALGHVDARSDADAVYSTSRKWLTGPRGVGMLGIARDRWESLDLVRPAMAPAGQPAPRYLESRAGSVADRLGLANAVHDYLADGPERLQARLAEVGAQTRTALAGVPGWTVVDAGDGGAITALRPERGQDVTGVRARLLAESGILTTACLPVRAPLDTAGPLLRLSPHVDATDEQLDEISRKLSIL